MYPKKQEVPEQNQGNAQDLPLAVQALFEADESITLSEVLNRLLAAEEAYKQASDQGEKNNIARAILFALEMLLGGEKNLNQTDANALGMIADIAQTIRNGM
jgi:mannose/fructose-specific phosphotransferase system component IIA